MAEEHNKLLAAGDVSKQQPWQVAASILSGPTAQYESYQANLIRTVSTTQFKPDRSTVVPAMNQPIDIDSLKGKKKAAPTEPTSPVAAPVTVESPKAESKPEAEKPEVHEEHEKSQPEEVAEEAHSEHAPVDQLAGEEGDDEPQNPAF